MLDRARELVGREHEIVSTWIDGHHETRPGIDDDASPEERAAWAHEDFYDVTRADCVVSFTEPPRGNSRGGRHVEFGIGLGRGKRMVLIGEREHVFHCLPYVEVYPDWDSFLARIDAE